MGRWLVEYWRGFFRDAAPRTVPVGPIAPPVLLFVDGAVEGEGLEDVGIGAVIVVPRAGSSDRVEHFSAKAGPALIAEWRGGVRAPSRSNPADAPSRGAAPGLAPYERRVPARAPAGWPECGCVEW